MFGFALRVVFVRGIAAIVGQLVELAWSPASKRVPAFRVPYRSGGKVFEAYGGLADV